MYFTRATGGFSVIAGFTSAIYIPARPQAASRHYTLSPEVADENKMISISIYLLSEAFQVLCIVSDFRNICALFLNTFALSASREKCRRESALLSNTDRCSSWSDHAL